MQDTHYRATRPALDDPKRLFIEAGEVTIHEVRLKRPQLLLLSRSGSFLRERIENCMNDYVGKGIGSPISLVVVSRSIFEDRKMGEMKWRIRLQRAGIPKVRSS